jgi:hypothetical protein
VKLGRNDPMSLIQEVKEAEEAAEFFVKGRRRGNHLKVYRQEQVTMTREGLPPWVLPVAGVAAVVVAVGAIVAYAVTQAPPGGPPPPSPGAGYTETVVVTDLNTGRPISGATISIDGYSGTTDSTGTAAISNIPGGLYTMKVEAAGYNATTFSVSIQQNRKDTVQLSTAPPPPPSATTEVVIVQGGPLGVIPGATVTLDGMTATTGSDGTARFTRVRTNSSYTITVSASGYNTATKSVAIGTVAHEDVIPLTPAAVSALNVQVTVYDSKTALPVSGASVALDGNTGTTNVNGVTTIAGVRPATYTLTVSRAGYQTFSQSITVSASQSGFQVQLVPVAAAQITFTVHVYDSTTNGPIPGALVSYGIASVNTDASGNAPVTTSDTTGFLTVTATGYDAYTNPTFSPRIGQTVQVAMTPIGAPTGTASMTFVGVGSLTANGVSVTYANNTIQTIVGAQAFCTVRDAFGATLDLGTSPTVTVEPASPLGGGTGTFNIVFHAPLPRGTWQFTFFVAAGGIVLSVNTVRTLTL